jgi:hypothetical protein
MTGLFRNASARRHTVKSMEHVGVERHSVKHKPTSTNPPATRKNVFVDTTILDLAVLSDFVETAPSGKESFLTTNLLTTVLDQICLRNSLWVNNFNYLANLSSDVSCKV